MAADLCVHVARTVEEIKHASLNNRVDFWSSKFGPGYEQFKVDGKWMSSYRFFELEPMPQDFERRELPLKGYDEKIAQGTPHVWIGRVSWLKAGLLSDPDQYLPEPVVEINYLCRDLPLITEALILKVLEALHLSNNANEYYSDLADPNEVELFLRKYMGCRTYTISW